MLVRRYEMPWRRAYEVYAGIAWWLALLYFVGVGVVGTAAPAIGPAAGARLLRNGRVAGDPGPAHAGLAGVAGRARHRGRRYRRPGSMVPGSGLSVPGLRLRMAAGAFAAALRTVQGRLPGVRRIAAPAATFGLRQQAPAGRRDRSALYSWRRAEGRPVAPAAAELRGRHVAGRHHPVRQGGGTRQPDHPGDPARRRGDRHRSEEQPAPEAGCGARLRGLPRAGHFPGVPPGLSGAGGKAGFHLQLAEAHRDRLAYPVHHAAGHGRRLLGLRLGCRQCRGAGPGRDRGTAEPDETDQVHRGRHRTGAGRTRCAATTTRPWASAGANCPR
jgi:hypothetical protein